MFERDQSSGIGEPRVAAGVVKEDESEQAFDLGLVGDQLAQQASEADGLLAQIGAQVLAGRGGVAFIEDQVEHCEDGIEAGSKPLGAGDLIADAGLGDLVAGADQPLRHGVGGDQMGAGDLIGGETADRAQRQCNADTALERRVAAGEDQLQPLVGDGAGFFRIVGCVEGNQRLELLRFLPEVDGAADAIDGLAAGGPHQPGGGRGGDAGAPPVDDRRFERVLQTVLGELEIAQDDHEARQQPAAIGADQLLDLAGGRVRCWRALVHQPP